MGSQNWKRSAEELGPQFAERAARHDQRGTFVADNYSELKEKRFFSLLVPEALGGGGATFTEACEVLHTLARYCPSTALALSMHQHLVAATVFKHQRGQPGAKLLKRVADEQLVLVSTGATDWINSNGSARRVEGGYRVSGRKVFASGSPVADVLVTTFATNDEAEGPSVIHCPVPVRAEGVRGLDDWNTLGMRGTGSQTVVIEDVFVPEEAVALKRARGKWHPAWDVTIGVAAPTYMSAYAGLASAAADRAKECVRGKTATDARVIALGELSNAATEVELIWTDMVRRVANLDFVPSLENTDAQLVRKTLLTQAVQRTVAAAIEVTGGAGFYKALPLERLWRDAQAAHFHPLPEKRQLLFTGRLALGREDHWDV